MIAGIWRLITGTRKCRQCDGKGWTPLKAGDRNIRSNCTNCRKTGSVPKERRKS